MEPEDPLIALARGRIRGSLKQTVDFIELNFLLDFCRAISSWNLLDHAGIWFNEMQMLAPSLLRRLSSQVIIGCIGRDSQQHIVERIGIFGYESAELSIVICTQGDKDVLKKIVDDGWRKASSSTQRSNHCQRDGPSETAQELLPGLRFTIRAMFN